VEKNLPEKVRPKTWAEVKGQDTVVKILKQQAIQKKSLANSYLFSGPSGVGKTTLARLFFMALNCESPKDGNPCMECSRCKETQYNLIEINGSDKRGIDDMREVAKESCYAGWSGGYKGILLDEAHQITKPAWNCLLRPIEDTNDSIIWLICTTEPAKIPKTIKTRCQNYKLSPLRYTDIFNRLKEVAETEKVEINEEQLWVLARNANNNMREALHLMEKYSITKDINGILFAETNLNFLEALKNSNISDLWSIFNSWETEYESMEHFLNAIKYDISSCLKIKLKVSVGQMQPYKKKKYEDIAQYLTEAKLIKTLEIILELQEKIGGVFDYSSLFLKSLIQLKEI